MRRKLMMMLFFLVLFPLQSFALQYEYNASGQFYANNVLQTLTGSMTISDVFKNNSPSGYYFDITGFNLTFNSFSGSVDFSGDSPSCGVLFWQDKYPFEERMWNIGNGADTMGGWGMDVFFYHEDMTQYDPLSPEYFGDLASIISLNIMYCDPLNTFPHYLGKIWLTRAQEEASPVPEPSTLMLMGAGLGCILIMMKRTKVNI